MTKNQRLQLLIFIFAIAALLKAAIQDDWFGMVMGFVATSMVGIAFVYGKEKTDE